MITNNEILGTVNLDTKRTLRTEGLMNVQRQGAGSSDSQTRTETPRLASIASRVVAWLIDSIVLAPVLLSLWLDVDPTPLLVAAQLWFLVYSAVGWSRIAGGQTVGMRVMHIQVLRLDGSQVGLVRAVARYLVLFLSLLLFGLPLLLVGVTKMRQALHDVITETVVVAVEPRNA